MQRLLSLPLRKPLIFALVALLLLAVMAFFVFVRTFGDSRSRQFIEWWRDSGKSRQNLITFQRDACSGAPFILPADGFIGLLYGDNRGPYSKRNPHQGIDIFSDAEPGATPVYAAYDGYITREDNWRSTLIQRVASDPFDPNRQIWLYYTHMANKDGDSDYIVDAFPAGTKELFVEQGTLLGYTGNYSGNALRPVWVHLHFSIVKDDGEGNYLNELEFRNSIDPSPYLGLPVNYDCKSDKIDCALDIQCS